MKTNLQKIVMLFLLSLIWCIPLFDEGVSVHNLIFVIGYFLTLICFTIIKDVFLGYLLILTVTVLVGMFETSYLKLMISPIFITCGYLHIIKRKITEDVNKTIDVGVIIGLLSSFILVIYRFFIAENNVITINAYDVSQSMVLGCFLFFLITVILNSFEKKTVKKQKRKKKIENTKTNRFVNIYVVNLICFLFTIILYYFTNTFEDYQNIRIVFFPWFLYCCLIMLCDESFVKNLVDRIMTKIRLCTDEDSTIGD